MSTVSLTYWQRVKLAYIRRPSPWERRLAWIAVCLSAFVIVGNLLSHHSVGAWWTALSYASCWLLAEYQREWAYRYRDFTAHQ